MHAAHERCSWCAIALAGDDGYRAGEGSGEHRAAFCRLEHVVPWAIRGAHWEPGSIAEPAPDPSLEQCAHCAAPLDGGRVLLVRHRGRDRVPDAFCGVAHLLDWAKAGGRWA